VAVKKGKSAKFLFGKKKKKKKEPVHDEKAERFMQLYREQREAQRREETKSDTIEDVDRARRGSRGRCRGKKP